jgi:uncharacterized protein YjiS (DUF1127 family)
MHTISQRTGTERFITRAGLAALWAGDLILALVWRAAVALVTWQERGRQRRHLASLDDYLLRDLGISRSDVYAELRKPFWEG